MTGQAALATRPPSVPVRRRRARRGHAPPRPGRGPHPHRAPLPCWEGGGEYNVARGLRKCFGLRTAVVTALADNEVGRLVEDLICTGGVDTYLIRWVPYDGLGRSVRNGLNFTERGFGVRGAVGVSDRGHTAASQLRPGDVDWDHLFGVDGVRWLHTGGIFAALGEHTADVAEEAMSAAPTGTAPSSPSTSTTGRACGAASADRRGPARSTAASSARRRAHRQRGGLHRGARLRGAGRRREPHRPRRRRVRDDDRRRRRRLPHLSVVATTLRGVRSATRNDWGAVAWAGGRLHRATHRPDLEIFDRVGGGDSFASGLVYGLLQGLAVDAGGRVRRRPRRARHDDARRHLDGHARRGPAARRGRWRPGRQMSRPDGPAGSGTGC